MPQRHCAVKDLRKSRKHRLHNLDIKTELKNTVKKFLALVKTDAAKAAEMLPQAYQKIDKAAKRNIIHKKTASRRKAGLAKLLTSKKA